MFWHQFCGCQESVGRVTNLRWANRRRRLRRHPSDHRIPDRTVALVVVILVNAVVRSSREAVLSTRENKKRRQAFRSACSLNTRNTVPNAWVQLRHDHKSIDVRVSFVAAFLSFGPVIMMHRQSAYVRMCQHARNGGWGKVRIYINNSINVRKTSTSSSNDGKSAMIRLVADVCPRTRCVPAGGRLTSLPRKCGAFKPRMT